MVSHLVLAAILFWPFEIQTKKSGFWMVKTSLDRFIKKRAMKKYFIHAKTVYASHSKSRHFTPDIKCPGLAQDSIRKPTTDRFSDVNCILFMTILLIKWVKALGTFENWTKFVRFLNCIWKPDHFTTGHKSTIRKPNLSGIWIITLVHQAQHMKTSNIFNRV